MQKSALLLVKKLPADRREAARIRRAYEEVAAADDEAGADVYSARGQVWFAVKNLGHAFASACARDFRSALAARGIEV